MTDEQQIIADNLGLVISIAKKFKYSSAEELEEYIHLGKIGFLKAYRRFDPSKKAKISTYAWYYIRKEILQHIRFKQKGLQALSKNFDIPCEPQGSIEDYLPESLTEQERMLIKLKIENYTIKEIIEKTQLTKHEVGTIYKNAATKIINANNGT